MANPNITLFFCPSYPTRLSTHGHAPPLSLAYLAQALQEKGYRPLAINGNEHVELNSQLRKESYEKKTISHMVQMVKKTQPDILFIAAWPSTLPFAREFSDAFKQSSPNTFIVFGGITATHLPEEIFSLLPSVDCVVRGEGQQTIVELVEAWKQRKDFFHSISHIKGLSYRKKLNHRKKEIRYNPIQHNPSRPAATDLDSLPLLDFSAFQNFDQRERTNFYLMTSFGCPYSCKFCSNPNLFPGYRKYSVSYLIDQVKLLEKLYGDIQMSFWDSDFTADKQRAISIGNAFAREAFSFQWFCYARVDEISKELLNALRPGGCRYMFFGIESTNPAVLSFYQKAKDIAAYQNSIPKSLDLCTKARISTILSFIIGAPVEGEKEINQTADDALALKKQNACVDQIELGMLSLEVAAPLWHRYRKGEFKIRKVKNEALCESYTGYQYFAKKYADEFLMTPQRYAIVHPELSAKKYEQCLLDVAKKLNKEGVL